MIDVSKIIFKIDKSLFYNDKCEVAVMQYSPGVSIYEYQLFLNNIPRLSIYRGHERLIYNNGSHIISELYVRKQDMPYEQLEIFLELQELYKKMEPLSDLII